MSKNNADNLMIAGIIFFTSTYFFDMLSQKSIPGILPST